MISVNEYRCSLKKIEKVKRAKPVWTIGEPSSKAKYNT